MAGYAIRKHKLGRLITSDFQSPDQFEQEKLARAKLIYVISKFIKRIFLETAGFTMSQRERERERIRL